MQQAVIGAGGAGIDISLFGQNRANTTQRQIAGNTGARNTTADN
jgi:hypothetical protein